MPRVRRRGHTKRDDFGSLAEKISKLTKWDFVPGEVPAQFTTPAEIEAFERERDRRAAEDQAQRIAMLRSRLSEWPVRMWDSIFAECVELEDELTPAQAAAWSEFKRNRKKLAVWPPRGVAGSKGQETAPA